MSADLLSKIDRIASRDPSGFAHLHEGEAPLNVLREMEREGLITLSLSLRGVAVCKPTAYGKRALGKERSA